MNKIPEWQYPLYKKSDKVAYALLKKFARAKKGPLMIGTENEINSFVKMLIWSQKMKDYRKFRDIVLAGFRRGKIDIKEALEKGSRLKIKRGIDKSWAIFIQDRRLCLLFDKFKATKIKFQGNKKDTFEFIIRFLLSQLLQDWRGPLMAVLLTCLKAKNVKISKLNSLLKIWDYTKIF